MDSITSGVSSLAQALGLVKPDKAKLVCVGPNRPSGVTEIACMFNPTEYRLSQSTSVNRTPTPAAEGGTPEFSGTGAMTLTMQLFFDDFSSAMGDVTPKINTLLGWMRPTRSSRDNNKPAPPTVAFRWGGNRQLQDFSGVLRSVVANYTIFRIDGTPVQAKVDITIEGQPDAVAGQNPTSRSIDSRRTHSLIDGDTLESVAYRELGKASYWRAIAELNGIDDPQRVPVGTVLLIPSAADAARNA